MVAIPTGQQLLVRAGSNLLILQGERLACTLGSPLPIFVAAWVPAKSIAIFFCRKILYLTGFCFYVYFAVLHIALGYGVKLFLLNR